MRSARSSAASQLSRMRSMQETTESATIARLLVWLATRQEGTSSTGGMTRVRAHPACSLLRGACWPCRSPTRARWSRRSSSCAGWRASRSSAARIASAGAGAWCRSLSRIEQLGRRCGRLDGGTPTSRSARGRRRDARAGNAKGGPERAPTARNRSLCGCCAAPVGAGRPAMPAQHVAQAAPRSAGPSHRSSLGLVLAAGVCGAHLATCR
jgi:hypothetical protein